MIAAASASNRSEIDRYIRARRTDGLKVNSLVNITVALCNLDRLSGGLPIRTLGPDDLQRIIEEFTKTRSPATATNFRANLKAYYTHLHDDELPKAYKRALKRQARYEFKEREPLTDDERDRLLAAAEDEDHPATQAKQQAIIWTL